MKLVKETPKVLDQKISDKEAEQAFIKILNWMGEDPNREGLMKLLKELSKHSKNILKVTMRMQKKY